MHNPAERTAGAEIVDDVREQIARLLATLLGERLRALGLDSGRLSFESASRSRPGWPRAPAGSSSVPAAVGVGTPPFAVD